MGKHKSLVRQVTEKINSMTAYGQSKHDDKQKNGGKPDPQKIYSFSTREAYLDAAIHFAKWAKETHGCRELDEARAYTGEYLNQRTKAGLSAWTVRLDAAALGKLYGCPTTELGAALPSRRRQDVTQHRTDAWVGHFNPERHPELVSLARSTGLRRHELAALRPEDVERRSDGTVWVTVRQGKGGKQREVEALDDTALRLAQEAQEAGRELVVAHIPKYAPIHQYRAEYAKTIYALYERPLEGLDRSQIYAAKGDLEGCKWDREAMLYASRMLGHNRLDVMTAYLD